MTKKLVLVPMAVCLHLALLYLVLLLAPAAGADQLRFPGSLEELRAVAALLSSPAMLYSFLTISRHSLHTLQVGGSGENIL